MNYSTVNRNAQQWITSTEPCMEVHSLYCDELGDCPIPEYTADTYPQVVFKSHFQRKVLGGDASSQMSYVLEVACTVRCTAVHYSLWDAAVLL